MPSSLKLILGSSSFGTWMSSWTSFLPAASGRKTQLVVPCLNCQILEIENGEIGDSLLFM